MSIHYKDGRWWNIRYVRVHVPAEFEKQIQRLPTWSCW